MLEKRKARGASSGGGKNGKAANFSTPYLTTSRPKKQSIRNLSALLDQALHLAEYHSDLADFHRCQAVKHRKVLRALQGLIPPRQQFNSEGGLFDG